MQPAPGSGTTRPAPGLAVDDAGAGPVVVLMHGLGGCRQLWLETLASLRSAGYRAIAYDHRGHGASPDVPAPWSIADLADDLAGLLDALAVDRACLVGHSMGGRAMFSFALDHPERITALVAVGAHSEAPHSVYRDILAGIREVTMREGIQGFRTSFEAAGEIPDRVRTDPDFAARFEGWFRLNRPDMIAAALDAILAMPTLTPRLPEIRVPMLSVVGERDLHFRELADRYATLVGRCRTTIVPATGHYPMVDAHAPFAARLIGFLGEVASGA